MVGNKGIYHVGTRLIPCSHIPYELDTRKSGDSRIFGPQGHYTKAVSLGALTWMFRFS